MIVWIEKKDVNIKNCLSKQTQEYLQDIILIISDVSVKNNIAILVLHIWREYKIIVKTIHYTMNILLTEAKLFTIRCSIS